MKKLLIYLLGATAVLSGCDRKSDLNIDGKSTDQRLSEALANYQKKLTDAPYGWILTEYTNGTALNGGVTKSGPKAIFSYYMKFDKSNRVSMISDFSPAMSSTFNTSSYFIKATQRPTLIFDTYSYVHVPCDPNVGISQSPYGNGFGWGADFEFSFADNVAATELGDTIHLTGNLNKTRVTLVKATQADQQQYSTVGFAAYSTFGKLLTYFKRVKGGAEEIELAPGLGGRTLNIKTASHPELLNVAIQYTPNSMVLETPIVAGGQTIKSFNNLVWNAGAQNISVSINGTTPAVIDTALDPIAPEKDIASNFYMEGTTNPWLATAGFHVNGVDDAYDILHLTYPGANFYRFVYFPGGVNGGSLDLISPFFVGGSSSYPYLRKGLANTFLGDNGQLIFEMLDYGGIAAPPRLVATNIIFATGKIAPPYAADSPGFYIVRKEDGISYDMVAAGDGLAWMTWSHQ
ncbi:MAG: DUF4302 domain-containing protein [Chitinophaga sp.]|uniref:DUF4302 domain-containing protein n=1 Tax=Chitinophaga sp. TaxID=1869181 RepID=UPI001B0B9E49|nr:DUF4302 domain-containing protein [Chitinophaga sp.]MBO9727367.1 DUF4302 domain-containing protein [Chitinophaga sp.]